VTYQGNNIDQRGAEATGQTTSDVEDPLVTRPREGLVQLSINDADFTVEEAKEGAAIADPGRNFDWALPKMSG
jgi:hypothetical protein